PGMPTNEKRSEQTSKWYDVAHPASAYIFPRETLLQRVHFDKDYMHLEITDGRVLSVPLSWIPTLHNAPQEEREKYEISQDRKMIIWDPDKYSINDEVRIEDYLAPRPESDAEKGKE
ncbi:MAG TPA: DUF2442 domain-containing protein, partial [Anaerolineales bacterium]|nr:DUF2442 domain-containing protein [Anaerolineales bacterium]